VIDGRTIEHIDFALPRTAVIEGRIADETGDPIGGVTFFAVRTEYFRGRRQLVPGTTPTSTDDAGHYRVAGVSPGTYVLRAMSRETWTVRRDGGKELMGFAPTYFPGTSVRRTLRRSRLVPRDKPGAGGAARLGVCARAATALARAKAAMANATIRDVMGPLDRQRRTSKRALLESNYKASKTVSISCVVSLISSRSRSPSLMKPVPGSPQVPRAPISGTIHFRPSTMSLILTGSHSLVDDKEINLRPLILQSQACLLGQRSEQIWSRIRRRIRHSGRT
jgi:hypothetical protein